MSLQSAVYTSEAVAVPGDKATPEQSVYYPRNLVADSSGVQTGTFVWIDSSGNLTNTKPASGAPVGFVERVLSNPIYTTTSGYSMIVPGGVAVNLAVKGDYYAKCDTSATVGQKLYAKTSGGIVTDSAGATVTSAVETSWRVVEGCASGGIAMISNW